LGAVATDPAPDPSQRIRELRRVRDRVSEAMESEPTNAARAELRSLVGQADTYIGDNQLRREARSLRHALGRIELREDAELREEMVEDGFEADALRLVLLDQMISGRHSTPGQPAVLDSAACGDWRP
jgi:hypothetical protein